MKSTAERVALLMQAYADDAAAIGVDPAPLALTTFFLGVELARRHPKLARRLLRDSERLLTSVDGRTPEQAESVRLVAVNSAVGWFGGDS